MKIFENKLMQEIHGEFVFNDKKLKELRVKYSLSIFTINSDLNFAGSTISKLETKKITNPKLNTVYKLSKYFNVPIEEFIIYKEVKQHD